MMSSPPAPDTISKRWSRLLLLAGISLLTSLSLAQSLEKSGQASAAGPQNAAAAPPAEQPSNQPSVSLSPAVIMAKGAHGQGLTQTLSLSNNTGLEFSFDMEAQDVLVKDGKRVFVAAGEQPGSIAATAVFSQKQVTVKPHSAASVEVRLTIPAKTDIRAVVAIFHGTNRIATGSSSVGMTASLGTLITFNLSDNIKLQPEPLRVVPATETTNLTVAEWVTNVGSEPVLPDGMAVVLDTKGNLVARIPVPAQRLLPGERLEFSGEYASQLQPGDYKAMCTLQFEGKTLTREATFRMQ